MLTRLLRTYLRRYYRQVGVVVALLAAQTFGNLYLPNLNADIINFGVVKGNVHYIWTTGAFTLMVIAPIMCVGGICMAIREDAALSLLLVVAVPVMVLVLGVVMILVVPQFRSMQVKIDRITEVLREQITGVRVIRAFVRGRSAVSYT